MRRKKTKNEERCDLLFRDAHGLVKANGDCINVYIRSHWECLNDVYDNTSEKNYRLKLTDMQFHYDEILLEITRLKELRDRGEKIDYNEP